MFWTKKRIIGEAKKYPTRKEWRVGSRSSYIAARYYKLLNNKRVSGHFTKTVLKTKWTRRNIIDAAKKFKTRKEWRFGDPRSYSRAKSKKFSLTQNKEIIDHFLPTQSKEYKKRQFLLNTKYPKKEIIKIARKFKSVSDWKKNNSTSYKIALKFGFINEAKKHMPPIGNRMKRCIYSIKIKNKKQIYIGLTYNFERRINSHLKSKRFSKYKKHNLIIKRLSNYIDTKKAALLEIKTIKKFKEKKYHLLNTAGGGGVGSGYLFWTKDKLINTAKKFNNVTEWSSKEMGAYLAAKQDQKLFNYVTKHFKRKKIKWDKKDILKIGLKYKKKIDWYRNDVSSYYTAYSRGWLNEATKHMDKYGWTENKLRLSANKYQTFAEWFKNEPNAYNSALKNKIIFNKITKHLKRKTIKWSKASIIKSRLSYKSKKEWRINNLKAYRAALRFGILEKIN